jgi:GNAT superfamily N-acetyltransferase
MAETESSLHPLSIDPLRLEDHKAAADVIAHAFRHEGFMSSTMHLSTPEQLARMTKMAETQLRYYHNAGHMLLAATKAGEIAGLAIVKLPDPQPLKSWYAQLPSLVARLPHVLPIVRQVKWRQTVKVGLNIKPPAGLAEPHYRLEMLGVAPGFQGQGIGGRLLEHIHAQVDGDAEAKGIFLYTGDAPNVHFYTRRGYETLEVRQAGQLTIWFMFRTSPVTAGREG